MAALGILTGGIAGLIGGMGQRLALRNKVPSAKGWVWATALGWTLKGATIYPLFNVLYSTSESIFGSRSDFSTGYLDELVIYAIVGLITGLEIGLGQWLVLRSLTGRAWIWPIVSALAYLLGFALSSALAHTIAPILAGAIHDFTILQISLAGGIAGIVTYISLANYLAWANE
ncbi:MAG TPA: hypothetical protein VJ183_18515 [Chloroflexia bacterium]|nr:hypothetical protein [Chloroflexia bacterium]